MNLAYSWADDIYACKNLPWQNNSSLPCVYVSGIVKCNCSWLKRLINWGSLHKDQPCDCIEMCTHKHTHTQMNTLIHLQNYAHFHYSSLMGIKDYDAKPLLANTLYIFHSEHMLLGQIHIIFSEGKWNSADSEK